MTYIGFMWLLLVNVIIAAVIAAVVFLVKKKNKRLTRTVIGVLLSIAAVVAVVIGYAHYEENKWFINCLKELYKQYPHIDSVERWGMEIHVYGEKLDEAAADSIVESLDRMLFEEKICPLFVYDEGDYPPCNEVMVFFLKSTSDEHYFCEYSAGYYYDGLRERVDNFQTWHKHRLKAEIP